MEQAAAWQNGVQSRQVLLDFIDVTARIYVDHVEFATISATLPYVRCGSTSWSLSQEQGGGKEDAGSRGACKSCLYALHLLRRNLHCLFILLRSQSETRELPVQAVAVDVRTGAHGVSKRAQASVWGGLRVFLFVWRLCRIGNCSLGEEKPDFSLRCAGDSAFHLGVLPMQ